MDYWEYRNRGPSSGKPFVQMVDPGEYVVGNLSPEDEWQIVYVQQRPDNAIIESCTCAVEFFYEPLVTLNPGLSQEQTDVREPCKHIAAVREYLSR
ncbi:MAG: hypothetical protein M3Z04_01600 [Chloroflexota bacterium]|nr:hypothetical protein [Chloroflexota bacterium]